MHICMHARTRAHTHTTLQLHVIWCAAAWKRLRNTEVVDVNAQVCCIWTGANGCIIKSRV